jgi:hypothetical protein
MIKQNQPPWEPPKTRRAYSLDKAPSFVQKNIAMQYLGLRIIVKIFPDCINRPVEELVICIKKTNDLP